MVFMSHSYSNVWIHMILVTKFRKPFIKHWLEADFHDFLKKELLKCGGNFIVINGTENHIHILYHHPITLSISHVAKQLKGSSSRWFNLHFEVGEKFQWQVGFSAFSVSQSQTDRVYHYIINQKSIHLRREVEKEIEALRRLNGC
ncbi:IS200/IS605 family transposase [Persicobacter sp. CCB-QB2]|uniref:IS200/IS605 family transposase n=1 Tax=Persicobacter sp. CCB-QB2 TaxID=1561025 RepID=UPI00345F2431